jgi:hypothetical protein
LFGVCYRADIQLGDELPAAAPDPLTELRPNSELLQDAYARHLFHGPDLQGLEAITGCGPAGITAVARRAPAPAAWFLNPLRSQWLVEPLVLDCAFQAMILWCCCERGIPSLPVGFASYTQIRRSFPEATVNVSCRITRSEATKVEARIDFLDSRRRLIARIDGYECVLEKGLANVFRQNQLPREVAR